MECRVRVCASRTDIDRLNWPTLANLILGNKTNRHALYITSDPPSLERLKFIHLTDPHASIRNDRIPEILLPGLVSDRLEYRRFLSVTATSTTTSGP